MNDNVSYISSIHTAFLYILISVAGANILIEKVLAPSVSLDDWMSIESGVKAQAFC
jgi:hypothetical protein